MASGKVDIFVAYKRLARARVIRPFNATSQSILQQFERVSSIHQYTLKTSKPAKRGVLTMKLIQDELCFSHEAEEQEEEPFSLDRKCALSIARDGKSEEAKLSVASQSGTREFLAAQKSSARSQNIPIPNNYGSNHTRRIECENRLVHQEQVAEIRDCAMFTRLVNGISERQADTTDAGIRAQNELCLAHIVATRYLPIEELERVRSRNAATGANHHSVPVQCTCPLGRMGQDRLYNYLFMNQNNQEHNEHVEMFEMDFE
eukprot:scaffold482_cov266-Amphora_coffeaeformis.AAC.14